MLNYRIKTIFHFSILIILTFVTFGCDLFKKKKTEVQTTNTNLNQNANNNIESTGLGELACVKCNQKFASNDLLINHKKKCETKKYFFFYHGLNSTSSSMNSLSTYCKNQGDETHCATERNGKTKLLITKQVNLSIKSLKNSILKCERGSILNITGHSLGCIVSRKIFLYILEKNPKVLKYIKTNNIKTELCFIGGPNEGASVLKIFPKELIELTGVDTNSGCVKELMDCNKMKKETQSDLKKINKLLGKNNFKVIFIAGESAFWSQILQICNVIINTPLLGNSIVSKILGGKSISDLKSNINNIGKTDGIVKLSSQLCKSSNLSGINVKRKTLKKLIHINFFDGLVQRLKLNSKQKQILSTTLKQSSINEEDQLTSPRVCKEIYN